MIINICLIIFTLLCIGYCSSRIYYQIIRRRDNSFKLSLTILLDIIETYKINCFDLELEKLKSQYDLNPNSKTNSIKAYSEVKNKLILETAKKILNQYITKDCIKTLTRFYKMDYILLIIVTNLKR